MKNSNLNTFDVDAISITEMKNKNGGCHADKQLRYLLKQLYQASIDETRQMEVPNIMQRFDKLFDEICTNEKL